MKVRCPYCSAVFEPGGKPACPECGKTVLLPGFYRNGKAPDTNTVRRQWLRDRPSSTAQPVFKRSLRLFVILVILFVIGSLLVRQARRPTVRNDASRLTLARLNLDTLVVALDRYRADTGRYPSTTNGLSSLVHNPGLPGWNGPYIFELKPDPWHRIFVYTASSNRYRLASAGPDGVPATEDDVLPTRPLVPRTLQPGDPVPVRTRHPAP